jgi:DNA repair protein RecN (Recombination protein N)
MSTKSLLLKSLNLKNFATFSDQTIEFNSGFNSIIGETGSGKSLILDALNFIFGQRADKKIIRKDADFSIIEASFDVCDDSIRNFFYEVGLPFEDEVVIKRVIYKNGKSKAFVNFQQCSLATLAELSKRYIDLVGQFENQKLFSEKYQLILLDNFIGLEESLKTYQIGFQNYLSLKQELESLREKQREVIQHRDFIDFQVKELNELNPSEEDELDLQNKKDLFTNTEENTKDLDHLNVLFGGDNESMGILDLLNKTKSLILANNSISEDVKNNIIDTYEKLKI